MSNLIKYVNINKDKSYKEMEFNEIDAAIYTLLSYLDFTNIVVEPITVEDAYQKFSNRFILKDKDIFMEENKKLFKEMATSKRYKDNILCNYEKVVNDSTQFGAISIVADNFKFVSFEGTCDELVGWEENFKLGYMYPVEAQKRACGYLKKNIRVNDLRVYVGGHSKGGNLAISAAMEQNIINRFKIKCVFNFDGPGFLDKYYYKTIKIRNKIVNYYPSESIVGMIFNSNGKENVVKSKSFGVFQHDLQSWMWSDKEFVLAKLSNYSKNMHQKIEDILKKFKNYEIERFVSLFFSILYNAGYTLKSELKSIDVNKIKNIIKESNNLSDNDKKLLLEMFKAFVIRDNKS